MAAIRAKIPIRDDSPSSHKDHVYHFIGTLEDRNLAKMVTMLRLEDADDLEETLQEYENMKVRDAHDSMGSSEFDSALRHMRPKFKQNQREL